MKINNEIKLEFLSISQNESFARAVIASFISPLNINLGDLSDIKTAVSEAVTNAIVHGYRESTGFIILECRLYEDNLLEIVIKDSGKGIEDIDKAREPLYTSQPEMERSGMGFTVMETFMDEVSVFSSSNCGTTVVMRKKL